MANGKRNLFLGLALISFAWSCLPLQGSEAYNDSEETITTKRRNGWRRRRSAEGRCGARKHKRWATWAVRDQPDYHNDEPRAGRATMREGTNGVTFSARKMVV